MNYPIEAILQAWRMSPASFIFGVIFGFLLFAALIDRNEHFLSPFVKFLAIWIGLIILLGSGPFLIGMGVGMLFWIILPLLVGILSIMIPK